MSWPGHGLQSAPRERGISSRRTKASSRSRNECHDACLKLVYSHLKLSGRSRTSCWCHIFAYAVLSTSKPVRLPGLLGPIPFRDTAFPLRADS
jgi:hypothetical protein